MAVTAIREPAGREPFAGTQQPMPGVCRADVGAIRELFPFEIVVHVFKTKPEAPASNTLRRVVMRSVCISFVSCWL